MNGETLVSNRFMEDHAENCNTTQPVKHTVVLLKKTLILNFIVELTLVPSFTLSERRRMYCQHFLFKWPAFSNGDLRNLTPSSPRPNTETSLYDYSVHSSQWDWQHLNTVLPVYTLSHITLAHLKPKQFFVHTWFMQISTYCKTSGML